MMFLRKCKVRENNRDTGVTAGGVLRFSSGAGAVRERLSADGVCDGERVRGLTLEE